MQGGMHWSGGDRDAGRTGVLGVGGGVQKVAGGALEIDEGSSPQPPDLAEPMTPAPGLRGPLRGYHSIISTHCPSLHLPLSPAAPLSPGPARAAHTALRGQGNIPKLQAPNSQGGPSGAFPPSQNLALSGGCLASRIQSLETLAGDDEIADPLGCCLRSPW